MDSMFSGLPWRGGIKMAKNERNKGEGGRMALCHGPCLQGKTTARGMLRRYKTAVPLTKLSTANLHVEYGEHCRNQKR